LSAEAKVKKVVKCFGLLFLLVLVGRDQRHLVFFGFVIFCIIPTVLPLLSLDFANSLWEVLFLACLCLLELAFFEEPLTWLLVDNRQAIELPEETLTAFIVLIFKENGEFARLRLRNLLGKWHISLQKSVQHDCALLHVDIGAVSHHFLEDGGENLFSLRGSLEEKSEGRLHQARGQMGVLQFFAVFDQLFEHVGRVLNALAELAEDPAESNLPVHINDLSRELWPKERQELVDSVRVASQNVL